MKLHFYVFYILSLLVLVSCGGQPSEDGDPVAEEPSAKSPGKLIVVGDHSYSFPDTKIYESSNLVIELKNSGESDISSLSFSSLPSDFSYEGGSFPGSSGNCPASLTINQTCKISLSYSPNALGSKNFNLEASYSSNGQSDGLSLSISARALAPAAPAITGLIEDLSPTNNAQFNWDCNRDDCSYRYAISTDYNYDISVESFSANTEASLSSGNGTFYLHVQALDNSYSIESTVQVIQFTMDTTAPTAPSALSFDLDATETSSSTLNWTEGTDDIAVGHYQLAIGTTAFGTDISDFVDVAGTSSGKVSGLSIVDGIDYYTTIRTVDSAGNFSTEVSSDAWRVPGPPEAINSLAATSALKNEITIGWSAPYHNGSSISDYIVEYRPSLPADGEWILLAEGIGIDTTASITGLIPSSSYEFKVRAYNGSTSPDSNILVVETAPDDPFFEPDVFQAMNLGGATKSIVVAWEDGTEFFLNDVSMGTFNAAETLEFDSSLGDVIRSDKIFFVSGRLTNGSAGNTDVRRNGNIVWNSPDWAGKEFIFTGTRDPNHIITIYAFEDAEVTMNKGATLIETANLLKGEFHTFSLSSNGGFNMSSDGLIMAYMYSSRGGSYVTDPKPLLPASFDIIGFPSTSVKFTTATSGTNANLYHSDSFTDTRTVNAGSDVSVGGRGSKSYYGGESLRIIADNPIVGNSNADSNGYCSAPFVPTSMLKKKFIVNAQIDYIAFASLEEGDITMEEPDGTITVLSLSRSGLDPYAPLKARVTGVPAGTKFYSDTRFQAWYQANGWSDSVSDDDETIMFGFD